MQNISWLFIGSNLEAKATAGMISFSLLVNFTHRCFGNCWQFRIPQFPFVVKWFPIYPNTVLWFIPRDLHPWPAVKLEWYDLSIYHSLFISTSVIRLCFRFWFQFHATAVLALCFILVVELSWLTKQLEIEPNSLWLEGPKFEIHST